jgi:hypothetical protein
MATKSERPRDTDQLTKFITDIATGALDMPQTDEGADPAAPSRLGAKVA